MKEIIIEEVMFWMDGGTMTLKMKKQQSIIYEVEFVQKMILEKPERTIGNYLIPGSLLLNGEEVQIRSELEKEILLEIRIAEFGINIEKTEIESLKKIILDAIDFVESEDYIKVAKKFGRI